MNHHTCCTAKGLIMGIIIIINNVLLFLCFLMSDTHVDPLVNATQQRLKRARLEQDLDSKIKNRPGPLELIEGNILKADNLVEQAVKGTLV